MTWSNKIFKNCTNNILKIDIPANIFKIEVPAKCRILVFEALHS